MRILWWSNAPWLNSGYGQATALFAPKLQRLGHELAIFAFVGLAGGPLTWEGLPVYPRLYDRYGNDAAADHARDWEADLVVSCGDAMSVLPSAVEGLVWAPWFPIDGDPLRPIELPRLRRADYPLVYSRWGEKIAHQAGIPARYVPLGVDTAVMCPGDKLAAREALGLPQDRYAVGMVAANQGSSRSSLSRKAFPEHLLAFSQFRRRHPDALLYLHTLADQRMGGLDLEALRDACDIPEGSVVYANQYRYAAGGYSAADVANVYRSLDVLMGVSYGEGFGVPIVEAQACGTPVVVGDWSAMGELCFGGVAIPRSEAHPVWNAFEAWQWAARPGAIADALEEVYRHRPASSWTAEVASLYDADLVVDVYWRPLLEEIAACRVAPRVPQLAEVAP